MNGLLRREGFTLARANLQKLLMRNLLEAYIRDLRKGAVAVLYGALDRKNSPLSPVLRSLVTVRVSQINGCHFCVDINSATLAKRSGSIEKMEKLAQWKESDLFDEKEKVVLEYTEAVTYSDQHVTDELIQRFKDFSDDDGIVELTGLIAFQNLSSKFNSALDVPPQGFCQLPYDHSNT